MAQVMTEQNRIERGMTEQNMSEPKKIQNPSYFSVGDIVYIGVFAATISVCALISIQTPWGVPFTLHTFAVALAAYSMGKWKGSMATLIWGLVGLAGVPVYSGFTSGFAKLIGPTGGYIWGFILMTFLCGMQFNKHKKWLTILWSLAGLMVCYLCGMLQFMLVMHMGWLESFLLTIAPYIVKDVISLFAAYALAIPIRRALRTAGYQVSE